MAAIAGGLYTALRRPRAPQGPRSPSVSRQEECLATTAWHARAQQRPERGARVKECWQPPLPASTPAVQAEAVHVRPAALPVPTPLSPRPVSATGGVRRSRERMALQRDRADRRAPAAHPAPT